jgi:hypothetical protein
MPSSYCNIIEWDELEQRYRNIITGDLYKTIEDIPQKKKKSLQVDCDCPICIRKK